MSVHVIYYEDGAKRMRPVLTRDEYMALRGTEKQKNLLKAVREGNTELKHRLVQMNYSCLPAENGMLKGSRTPSTTVGMDIDFVAPKELSDAERRAWMDERMAQVPELVLSKKEELGLLMLERSATKGYHLVFGRRQGLTQEENLRWASELLGVRYDEGAKDITRVFFTTSDSAEDLLYLDDSIFEIAEGGANAETSDATDKKISNSPFPEKEENRSTGSNGCSETASRSFPTDYKGIPYADIIGKYWELFNEGKEPTTGDRDTLTYQLACDLRHICGRDEEWLYRVIPCYDGFPPEEKRKKIQSALTAKSEGMPYRLKQVLQALKAQAGVRATGGTLTTPPPMPRRLPPLIRLLTRNVPDIYKPAVASAVFPALAAHLHGVKFRYWDNVEHEATFMNVLIGRQSVGKGAIKKPIEYIMDDIRLRDIPNREREAEWKQKNPTAKQKKDPRPKDICIQMLIDNLTDAVFNQRIVDAHNNGERYVYTIVDEIDALKKVTSRGTVDEVGLLIRKAFDNSLAGQERVGADSVSGIAPLRWNFNASTTPPNARKFFHKMVNDGTVSRLDIATIIRPDDDDSAPILGIYDHSFAQELKPYLERLEAASGLIECRQARRLAMDMRQENSDAARLYESDAYRVLSYRANVIAWLKGMVLYVANGEKWDKAISDFVRWAEQYNMWCKMLYFGQQLEKELREEVAIQRQAGPQNLLELLPDEFTREQYRHMRSQQGKEGAGDSTLRTWVARGYITYDEATGNYSKTAEYKRKYSGKEKKGV